jgi:hypothetical protein
MLLNLVTLSALTICCSSCAPKIYVPNVISIKKGEASPIDGFLLTPSQLKAIGDIKIDNR